jgi:hypothetical protein
MAGPGHRLKRLLADGGCSFVRHGRGDHEIWWSPITETHFTVDSGCRSKHTANETLKQAGLPKAF